MQLCNFSIFFSFSGCIQGNILFKCKGTKEWPLAGLQSTCIYLSLSSEHIKRYLPLKLFHLEDELSTKEKKLFIPHTYPCMILLIPIYCLTLLLAWRNRIETKKSPKMCVIESIMNIHTLLLFTPCPWCPHTCPYRHWEYIREMLFFCWNYPYTSMNH